jgi:hypothetical protein
LPKVVEEPPKTPKPPVEQKLPSNQRYVINLKQNYYYNWHIHLTSHLNQSTSGESGITTTQNELDEPMRPISKP